MSRTLNPLLLLLPIAGLALPGCFWGEVDGGARFTVSGANVSQYVDLLYPTDRQAEWEAIFADRPTLCPPDDEGCDNEDRERSDVVDLFLRYDTTRVRGLLTQKGDLQITAHLDVGQAYKALIDDSFDDWDYLTRTDRMHGAAGDACDSSVDAEDRSGVGRCVFSEIEANDPGYRKLDEDIRLVMLVNLPGEDDVRSVECQDRARTFASDDWEYPRALLVNYDATGPIEDGDDSKYGGEDDPPLPLCDVEVFSRLNVATQVFGGDFFGEGDENTNLTIEEGLSATDEPLVGSVIIEELTLPSEGQGRAKGKYHLAFTAQRFSEADGKVVIEGSFDTEVRLDPVAVDDPDREIDLDPEAGGEL